LFFNKNINDHFDEKFKAKQYKYKKSTSKTITTFDEHLNNRYGKVGTAKRTEFDIKAKAFAVQEIIKAERKLTLTAPHSLL